MSDIPNYTVHVWKRNLNTVTTLYATEMFCGTRFIEHEGEHISVDPEEANCLKCLRTLRRHLAWCVARDAEKLEVTIARVERVEFAKAKKARARERRRVEKARKA